MRGLSQRARCGATAPSSPPLRSGTSPSRGEEEEETVKPQPLRRLATQSLFELGPDLRQNDGEQYCRDTPGLTRISRPTSHLYSRRISAGINAGRTPRKTHPS